MGLDRTRYAGTGIALVRVVMGLMLFYSGLTKLMALGGVVGFFGMMRIPAPEILAPVIAAGEVVGGLLLVLGLGIRFVSVWFIAQFLVTTFYVKLRARRPWAASTPRASTSCCWSATSCCCWKALAPTRWTPTWLNAAPPSARPSPRAHSRAYAWTRDGY